MRLFHHTIFFSFMILLSISCGQQKSVLLNSEPYPKLIIQDITYKRISSLSHDQYGKTQIENAKVFNFIITLSNIGGADFVGQLSVSNTRSDLNQYVHTQSVSNDIIRIPPNGTFDITISDSFPYSVTWVRFKVSASLTRLVNGTSTPEHQLLDDIKEIRLPEK